MKVSVIIVSHDMCAPLRQSLQALNNALDKTESEIIVIDNGSTDRTAETVIKEFPQVRLMSLNPGKRYTQAGNQGIGMARGEYILLLSADAVVKPKTIQKTIEFMDSHTTAGGVSVRLVDKQGNYLPESKKVLPHTWVAFLKFTGLLKQFKKSRLTEYLGNKHEDEFETTETDVLNNCFMLVRNSVLKTVGLLDERFSGYGTNIDLSQRIKLAGFKNFYFPKTYIINLQYHKVSKFSWQHLRNFYGALIIFALKYLFRLPALPLKPLQELYPAYEFKG